MSFPTVASYQSDKDLFGQSYQELGADFFDLFLTFGPAESEEQEIDYTALPESTYLERSTSSHSGGTPSSTTEEEVKQLVGHGTWQGESTASSQNSSARGAHFYAELSGRAAISDSELLSLEGISLESPQIPSQSQSSLPTSPTQPAATSSTRKTRIVEVLAKPFKKATGSLEKTLLRSPVRISTPALKMLRTAHSNASSLDLWGQKLDLDPSKFKFDFEDTVPLSPRKSTRISDLSENSNSPTVKREYSSAFSHNNVMPQKMVRAASYEIPLATPMLTPQHSRNSSSHYGPLSGQLFPMTPQHQNLSGSWSQLPGSPDLNVFGASIIYPDLEAPLFWNHAATAKAQPSPTGILTNPQRATKSLGLQLQNNISYDTNDFLLDPSAMTSGLMIQMPGAGQQAFGIGSPPMRQRGFFDASPSQPQDYRAPERHYAQVPRQQQHDSSPIRKHRPGYFHSPSPRSPPSPTFHVKKRKTRTNKQSTPRTPTLGGAVDFVNYTPSDSQEILTGVAPSGSSKTKARREKEAMEKRRKLSLAALRAVRAAGGDVESLVEQGLLI
jgi:hypothetical protein